MGAGSSVSWQVPLMSNKHDSPIVSWTDLVKYHAPDVDKSEIPLHMRGVSGKLLWSLLNMPEFSMDWSTAYVCTEMLKPATAPYACSFVHFASSLSLNGEPVVGTPTRFISHTWSYPIARTLRSVLHSSQGGYEEFYWMDIFCLNQHCGEIGHPEFNRMLHDSMVQPGHTLFVCYPWHQPISITRAWCLYEVMESLKQDNNIIFTPVLDPDDRSAFIQALLEDTSALVRVFINVNARQASAYLKEDLDMIFGWIQSSVGFDAMNASLQHGLCSWIKDAGASEIDARIRVLNGKVSEERVNDESSVTENADIVNENEIARLTRRRTALIEDMNRFIKVPPLVQTEVLNRSSLNVTTFPSKQIPVLLGTTHQYKHLSGGALPAFLQILVSQSSFRNDVRLALDVADKSRIAQSQFVSELRSVCDLWETATDGIISLDMLIEKFPPESKRLSTEAADIMEFVHVIIDENKVFNDFWPNMLVESYMWHMFDDGNIKHKLEKTRAFFLDAEIPMDIAECSLKDALLHRLGNVDEIDGVMCPKEWGKERKRLTVKKATYWGGPTADGRLAIHIKRFQLDFSTFSPVFNPTAVHIPREFDMSDTISEFSPQYGLSSPVYSVKGVVCFARTSQNEEHSTSVRNGVFETYIETGGQWWFASEFRKSVECVTWEEVQAKCLRSAIIILLDTKLAE